MDMETKFHFILQPRQHIQRHRSNSGCNPSAKLGRDSTIFLYMSFMYPQKKQSVGVQSGIHRDKLIGPPMPVYRPENHSSGAVVIVAPKCNVASPFWKMRLSISATICGNTKFSSISRQTARVMVLSWKKQDPTIWSDMMLHVTLTLAVANMLHQGMWVLAAPTPAIEAVYNMMYVENGLLSIWHLSRGCQEGLQRLDKQRPQKYLESITGFKCVKKNWGTAETKQKPVTIGYRTTCRTLSPERTPL